MEEALREPKKNGAGGAPAAFFQELWALWKSPAFALPVVLFTLLGFGATLVYPAVGNDDLSAYWHIDTRFWIKAGRGGWYALTKLLDGEAMQPFNLQFVGLILLLLAVSVFCVVLQRASGNRLKPVSLVLFSCAMMTYPLINEAWTFDQNCEMIGAGFVLTSAALAMMAHWLDPAERGRRKQWWLPVCTAIIFIYLFLTYEAFAVVYAGGVFCVLILQLIYRDETRLAAVIGRGLLYAAPIATAYVPKLLIPFAQWHIPVDFESQIKDLLIYYGIAGKWYLPITILQGCVVVACIFALVYTLKKKPTALLLFAGSVALLFSMEFLARGYTGYRTNLYASLFVGFVGLLLCEAFLHVRKTAVLRVVLCGLLFFGCFRQATNLNHWFMLDERQFVEQAATARGVAERVLSECDYKKPLEFVGIYELSDDIMQDCAVPREDPAAHFIFKLMRSDAKWFRYWQSSYWPVLVSGLEFDSDPGFQITRLMSYLGYPYFTVGSRAQYEAANRAAIDMPAWPAKGAIRETDDCIIVKLGEIWIPPDSTEIQYAEQAG